MIYILLHLGHRHIYIGVLGEWVVDKQLDKQTNKQTKIYVYILAPHEIHYMHKYIHAYMVMF